MMRPDPWERMILAGARLAERAGEKAGAVAVEVKAAFDVAAPKAQSAARDLRDAARETGKAFGEGVERGRVKAAAAKQEREAKERAAKNAEASRPDAEDQ
jgi:hypothetical protein